MAKMKGETKGDSRADYVLSRVIPENGPRGWEPRFDSEPRQLSENGIGSSTAEDRVIITEIDSLRRHARFWDSDRSVAVYSQNCVYVL